MQLRICLPFHRSAMIRSLTSILHGEETGLHTEQVDNMSAVASAHASFRVLAPVALAPFGAAR